MTRDEAAVYLGGRLAQYLVAVGRTATDTTGNLAEIINDALRALGTPYADLATTVVEGDAAIDDYVLQLTYRGLLQITRDLGATHFNVATGGDSYQLGQIRASAEKDLAIAEQAVIQVFGSTSVPATSTDGASDWLVIVDTNTLAGGAYGSTGAAAFDPYASVTP